MGMTKAELRRFREGLAQLSDSAAAYVGSIVEAWQRENPDATVAETREAVIEAVDEALNAFGDQASAYAGELFDELAAEAGSDAEWESEQVIDRAQLEKRVRYFARKLVDGNEEGFGRDVRDLTRCYVKRTAFENMSRNCERNDVRYARVPSGLETCAFCYMLSSRGFVYKTEKSAGGDHQYHPHCDCIVVPGFEDIDQSTQVEGYNPEEMRKRWRACAETAGIDPDKSFAAGNREAVMAELETRDWKWLNEGREPKVSFASSKLQEEIEENRKHEIRTSERLAKHGVPVDLVIDEERYNNPEGLEQTKGLADYASGSEIKTLQNATTFNTIDGYIKNTSRKKNAKILYFDNTENIGLTDDELAALIQQSRRFKRGRIYILKKNGELTLIKRASQTSPKR